MNELVQIYKFLKQIAPEAICISKASPQGGVYLLFDGIKSVAWKKDRASFRIIFASHSLVDDNFSALSRLDELRQRFIAKSAIFGEDAISEMKFDGFEDSLFKYSFVVEVDIYRDEENEDL